MQIALLGLLGFCCALPALQLVLAATFSISLLGRKSSNIYIDRLLEYINNIQQRTMRCHSAAAFARAQDLTTLLQSMLHVRHAFEAAETGAADGDDPITESMLVQARLLQDEFRRKLGTDLTQPVALNPFWHTGNAVACTGTDCMRLRPWEFVWRVAEGASIGKSRGRAETWDYHIRRFLFSSFFRM